MWRVSADADATNTENREKNNSKTISRRFISLDTASEFRLVEFSREVYGVIGSWPSRRWGKVSRSPGSGE